MKTRQSRIGLDSNCYTFLIEAMAGIDEPTDPIAEQRVALFRTFLYRHDCLFLTPTVVTEYKQIPDDIRAAFHQKWTTLFCDTQPVDTARINARADVLLAFHQDPGDCRIVAEAEDAGLAAILSFDTKFIAHLAGKTAVALRRPLDYWSSLKIPKGAMARWTPRYDNPMAGQTWWQWK